MHLEGRHVGYDRLLWEPHGDRTAWFERHARFAAAGQVIDRKVQARFRLREWPDLLWLRYRDAAADITVELVTEGSGGGKPGQRVIPPAGDLIPSFLADLVAASGPRVPGEAVRCSILHEAEARIAGGYAIVCKGEEEIEAEPGRLKTVRYALERDGKPESASWVDENRRIRRIDLGGPVALLSTRERATAAVPGEAP